MKESFLLFIDALLNLALGALLLFLPLELISALGIPIPESTFYVTLLGAVLFGVGLALLVERFRSALGLTGLGLTGAMLIKVCVATALILWLVYGNLDIPRNGQIVLWGLAIILATLTILDIGETIRLKNIERALQTKHSQVIKGDSHLGKAIAIAAQAHQEQKDRAGMPYILHPLRVMQGMDSEMEKIAATLHDVVENTSWTTEQLKAAGFSQEVLKLVHRLTRDPDEPYETYINRVSEDPVAIKIKLADLEDNMDLRRLPELSDENLDWLKEYHRHWLALQKTQNPSQSKKNGR
ncbi:MAG: HD domain-containing protein [Anaerolineales bacterium]|nr:HD domain-containing protein [Anaerolineales bacterium]